MQVRERFCLHALPKLLCHFKKASRVPVRQNRGKFLSPGAKQNPVIRKCLPKTHREFSKNAISYNFAEIRIYVLKFV